MKNCSDEEYEGIFPITKPLYLAKLLLSLRREDYVLFNTVSPRSILLVCFVALFESRKIYYVRNAKSWIYSPKYQTNTIFRIIGTILFLLKKWLQKGAHAFAAGSFNLKDFLMKEGLSKPVLVLPFNLFASEKSAREFLNEKFSFVVPGTIDLNRKDLSVIRDASYLLFESLKGKFEIVLLGRPVDGKSEHFAREWKNVLGNSLTFYNDFIPSDVFDSALKQSNVVMGALNVSFKDRYHSEKYGETKDTGIEAHAISYARPIVVNSEYRTDLKIQSSTLYFKDRQSCFEIMKKLILNKEYYLQVLDRALENSDYYTIDSIASEVSEELRL